MKEENTNLKTQQMKQKKKALISNLKLTIPPKSSGLVSHLEESSQIQKISKKKFKTLNEVRFSKDKTIEENFDHYFQKVKKIGEGCHSVVFWCRDRETKKNFAVKVTRKRDLQHFQDIRESFLVVKKLDHPNVLRVNYLFMNQNLMTFHLVSELIEYETLLFYMMKQKNITQSEVAFILEEILITIHYLHQKGVCHRDIKPDNILYDPVNKKIKIIDFQCAKMTRYVHQQHQLLTRTGVLNYKAPQLFSPSYYNEKIDIWAVGIIGYQLLTRKHPFPSQYEQEKISKIKEAEPDYTLVPSKARSLLKKLLIKNPKERISAKEALHEEFFLLFSQQPHYSSKNGHIKSWTSIPSDIETYREHKKSYDTNCTQELNCELDGDIGLLKCKKMTP